MLIEPYVTPAGALAVREAEGGETAPSVAAAKRLLTAADAEAGGGSGAALLELGAGWADAELGPRLGWLRAFARAALTAWCRAAAQEAGAVETPSEAALAERVTHAPPLAGGEYLRPETLAAWWEQTGVALHAAADAAGLPIGEYLASRHASWRAVGRVTFHLAENQRDEARPFAFLATYADGPAPDGTPRHRPLGKAIETSAGSGDRATLLGLLTPIYRAAERADWLREAVVSGAVYRPLAWTTGEAYAFLRSVDTLQAAGLAVRTPDWWSAKKRPRPTVSVQVGGTKGGAVNTASLLSFSVSVTLEGETLSPEEMDELLSGGGGDAAGLVRLRGRWVELDRDRLGAALDHWKEVEAAHAEGVGFSEAMRWMSGAQAVAEEQEPSAGADPEDPAAWVGIEPGPWLEETLATLRDPACLAPAEMPGLKARLRPYQATGVGWLGFMSRLKLGACLADDMGLGKTLQVLALLLRMKRADAEAGPDANLPPSPSPPPSLLVVPASLLANWAAERDRFAPSLQSVTLHPAESAVDLKDAGAVKRAVAGVDLAITTYGMLTRLDVLRELPWRLVVLDEAQAIKNSGTRQTHAVKKLTAESRVVLTGTPVENRLSDLWSLFDFLNPGLLGSAAAFKRLVKQMGGDDDRPADYAPLRRLVGPYILRRLKTDKSVIADLPEKTEVQAWCGLSKPQAKLYQASVDEMARELREGERAGIHRRGLVLGFLTRFKQVCNHPAQFHGTGAYAAEESGKFLRLRSLCEEIAARQERVLVFTQFREVTAPLAEQLGEVFGRSGLVLHGGTPVKKRQQMVQRFQAADGPPFLVLSLKAGGTGLNLTAASHVVHFDRWWNPAVENQATDRAFRIGQKRNVLVHKFVCRGTIEEKIDAMIQEKTAVADAVLGGEAEKRLTEMDDVELLDFVKLDVARAGEL
ncbi:DEAD/DEAH box helicase [Phycisphaera mikurensis]|uniref:Putative helicase n=1 Tax=Phycisphaera mikurensis (strain NBRC 102666 / KCTC 22515 / FYK2301M01) TaxID=1142394 RepID=I0IJ47_PHYMF|nr:DEAD/DEAH box helicase [Phycisphaera mikurensis]MBB6443132.1 non-specific serine/threonine protein kinase [Phycisphaera mikurensis]BAM05285.1 putative helicase [Phycisphaera mikurensis NBRC 102666]